MKTSDTSSTTAKSQNSDEAKSKDSNKPKKASVNAQNCDPKKCTHCEEGHLIHKCQELMAISVEEKRKVCQRQKSVLCVPEERS